MLSYEYADLYDVLDCYGLYGVFLELLFRHYQYVFLYIQMCIRDRKYTPADGTIALRFAAQSRTLCLSVSNPTGTEITPAELERVFDRFYRTDPSRSSATGGYGIGLSVAKAIVTAHGGKIQADKMCIRDRSSIWQD